MRFNQLVSVFSSSTGFRLKQTGLDGTENGFPEIIVENGRLDNCIVIHLVVHYNTINAMPVYM